MAIGKIKFNKSLIAKEVFQSGSKVVAYMIRERVADAMAEADAKAEAEFDRHPVTKELKQGEDGQNISGTLNGYGNLFSFIGFYEGENPIGALKYAVFEQDRDLFGQYSVRKVGVSGNKLTYSITVKGKPLEEIYKDPRFFFPDDWRGGTWVEAIESGISGFEYYLSTSHPGPSSRSMTGIQVKTHKIREGSMSDMLYLSKVYASYEKRLRKLI
jgi:hypothetical protein